MWLQYNIITTKPTDLVIGVSYGKKKRTFFALQHPSFCFESQSDSGKREEKNHELKDCQNYQGEQELFLGHSEGGQAALPGPGVQYVGHNAELELN